MNFLIYEPDPLVLSDIEEALRSAFADANVVTTDCSEELGELAARLSGPSVGVISVTAENAARLLTPVMEANSSLRAVLISSSAQHTLNLSRNYFFVQRPFSTTLLLQAISSACFGLPAFRS